MKCLTGLKIPTTMRVTLPKDTHGLIKPYKRYMEEGMATKKEETKPAATKRLPAVGEWYVFTAEDFAQAFGDRISYTERESALVALRQATPGPFVIVKVTHRPVVEAPKQTSFIVRPNPTAQKKGGE